MYEELRGMVGYGETIYYEGKPNKKAFILESIFNPLLPFVIIWCIVDIAFLIGGIRSGDWTILFFLAIHMLPVWMYLGNIITIFLRLKHSYYIVTDHAVYISSGTIQLQYNVKTFTEMSRVFLHRGIFDRMFGIGDVVISTNQRDYNGRSIPMVIANISNYNEVYQMVSKLQKDIYSDTMYPNDLRPETNGGYKTKYNGFS